MANEIPSDPDFFLEGKGGGGGKGGVNQSPGIPGFGPGGGAGGGGFGSVWGGPFQPQLPAIVQPMNRRIFAAIPAGLMRTSLAAPSE